MLVFLAGAGVCLLTLYFSVRLFLVMLPAALIAFGTAVAAHRRIRLAILRQQYWVARKETHIARMTLNWRIIPQPSAAAQPEHPFEQDLDLTGPRSIHQLLDTSASFEGSQRLQSWLLDTQPRETIIRMRQAQVQELIRRPLFIDKLAMHGAFIANRKTRDADLVRWMAEPMAAPPSWALPIISLLAVANLIMLGLAGVMEIPPVLRGLCFLAYVLIYLSQFRYLQSLFEEALELSAAFQQIESIFRFLETYRYGRSDALIALCQPLLTAASRPSILLRRLNRALSAASIQGNQIFWILLNAAIPWDLAVYTWLRRVKAGVGDSLPQWLNVWHELEALGSLATYGYLNPATTFPDLTNGQPLIRASQLGHPLIPDDKRVRNDFEVSAPGQVLLITGSNMAGKSSFLRTVGINCVLAFAGGPIDAETMQIALFRLYTSMRISDSVNDGISYFYAEVRRLRALLSALEEPDALPLFFLIDEIFRGTNNRERLIGSRSYIRALIGKNGAGLVSTHDLELVRLADELPTLSNYHFREEVVDGQMIFDYKLRSGPSPTTNALKVMRLAGLPVEET